ncbi:serine/threonine-protein kinase NIM1 [Lutzomyia longipalpis]|uniref:serine/threonine-protein kinase NIM1 n=1 Tax=Lutzomyia longipalpis TaxID=7200 RepID=UPI002483E935|nr:serine/threonine-protein kinase NIM1 [Lutzomyia longipalpis]XP_055684676.1 serine/threonine-protein kinase NIM1 [Lutzomyia longipalpis]
MYKFCKDIGRGNFSKVKLAVHQLTRDSVAIKVVDRTRLDARALRMLSREVTTLECVHHPNILRLFEVVETLNRVHLVTEFISGGELYHRLINEGPIQEQQACKLFRQLLSAVRHMHNLGFVHRDIKAENVLLVNEDKVKLADFGFSTQLSNEPCRTFCGSPPYAAPELFSDDDYVGKPVDVWALGVLLYFMIIGNMPFRAPTVPALRAAVLKGDYLLPGHLTLPLIRLMQRILVHVPSRRPTIEQMIQCQWLNNPPKPPNEINRKKSGFWRIKARNIRSSRSTKDLAQLDSRSFAPIACNTRRGNSVLEDNFLFPLDVITRDEAESEHANSVQHRRSFFGANSKKKIGPMETERRESGKMFKRGSCIEIMSNNEVLNDKKHILMESKSAVDIQHTPSHEEEEGEYIMKPSFTYDLTHLHPLEIETRRILEKLGISSEMLCHSISSGPRSDVIGAYRIVINRLQKQILLAKLKETLAKEEANATKSKGNTTSCVIL